MLNSKNRLKKRRDFDRVFKNAKSVYSKTTGIKVIKNNKEINRFAVLVGLKVSKKAVERNLIKRRIKAVIKEENKKIKQGNDIIIISLPLIKNIKYPDIKKDIQLSFKKLNLYNSKLT